MEQSLLRGESSGLSYRRRGPFRRSDALTYGSNYEKAAALIDLVRLTLSSFVYVLFGICFSELIVLRVFGSIFRLLRTVDFYALIQPLTFVLCDCLRVSIVHCVGVKY